MAARLNAGRMLGAGIAVGAWLFLAGYVVEGVLLAGAFEGYFPCARPEEEMPIWMFGLTSLLRGIVLAWIFHYGYQAGRGVVLQGVRFGLLLGFVVSFLVSLEWWACFPVPLWLMAGDGLIWWLVVFPVAGILIAAIYRPAE